MTEFLLLELWIPGADDRVAPDMIADELVAIINDQRARNGGPYPPVMIAGLPAWISR